MFCPKCKTKKAAVEFYKNSARPNGHDSHCKECRRAWKKSWAKNNRKELSEYNRQWRIENTQRYLWNKARNRAKNSGLEFSIEIEDIIVPQICPVLGIKLEFPKKTTKGNNPRLTPNSPSIDRIDNNKGYVKGNIVVISSRANIIKSDGSLEEFEKLTKFLNNLDYEGTECENESHCW